MAAAAMHVRARTRRQIARVGGAPVVVVARDGHAGTDAASARVVGRAEVAVVARIRVVREDAAGRATASVGRTWIAVVAQHGGTGDLVDLPVAIVVDAVASLGRARVDA